MKLITIKDKRLLLSWETIAYMLGFSLVAFAIHSEWLTLHDSEGKVLFFVPWFGILGFCAVISLMLTTKEDITNIGPKRVWIPMVIIVGFIAARVPIERSMESIAEVMLAGIMFGLYLCSRKLGKQVLWPVVIFGVIEAISVVVYVLFLADWDTTQLMNGGILSKTNYAEAAGVLVIGMCAMFYLMPGKLLAMMLAPLFVIAIVFTGSPIGIVSLVVLALYTGWNYRRSIGRKAVVSIAIIGVILLSWAAWGPWDTHMERTKAVIQDVTSGEVDNSEPGQYSWGQGRIPAYKRAINNVQFFGHEYDIYKYQIGKDNRAINAPTESNKTVAIVHNVPLVIVDQVGPVVAVAWSVASLALFWIASRRMKVVWIGVASLCLFDHFIWTTIAPWWWALAGITIWEYENGKEKGKAEVISESC